MGHEVTVALKRANWEIENKRTGQKLILVPMASWNTTELKTTQEGNKLIIPCCLNGGNTPFVPPSDWITGNYAGPLILSPLDFYLQERLIILLKSWILLKPFSNYGQLITKLPRAVMPQFKKLKKCKVEGDYSVRLMQPISKNASEIILNTLKAANASISSEQFETAMAFMDQISRCPFCQERANHDTMARSAGI